MTDRGRFLDNVRQSLGHATSGPPPLPAVRLKMPEMPLAERLERFRAALERLRGSVWEEHGFEAARQRVAALTGGAAAVAASHPLLASAGITASPGVASGFTSEPELRRACAAADFGITGLSWALADTGSFVFLASAQEPRMISLLPPVHIAVFQTDQLLSGLDELFTRVSHPASVASSMVIVTGCSRTGDIEQILVPGVHGPGKVHAVIVQPD